jgi:hypothetical protein
MSHEVVTPAPQILPCREIWNGSYGMRVLSPEGRSLLSPFVGRQVVAWLSYGEVNELLHDDNKVSTSIDVVSGRLAGVGDDHLVIDTMFVEGVPASAVIYCFVHMPLASYQSESMNIDSITIDGKSFNLSTTRRKEPDGVVRQFVDKYLHLAEWLSIAEIDASERAVRNSLLLDCQGKIEAIAIGLTQGERESLFAYLDSYEEKARGLPERVTNIARTDRWLHGYGGDPNYRPIGGESAAIVREFLRTLELKQEQ